MFARKRKMAVGVSVIACSATAAAVVLGGGVASADNLISLAVGPGVMSAFITDTSLTPVTFSFDSQVTTGTLTVNAKDKRNNGAGWRVTIENTTPWTSPALPSTPIPAAGYSNTANGAITTVKGGSGINAPTPSGGLGVLTTPRQTMSAALGKGKGEYTQPVSVSLTIPGETTDGTYTTTMVTSIVTGP